ncbi:uncharacterized protein LOC130548463 isoform X2 [Triplophysa rosa]|uniref:uncharacterized protein LOC130548463 isoform X2 n=1 Tax=Triplophysa rosa TaxID=992332 RepID=UPI002545E236|nr:uncharacterized protein LOC130548463 isoform X2 [Triplophysa rosa]
MKTRLLVIVSLFINGVFGDETERVTVNDGGSVTLHTNLTELQSKDVIMWRFKGRRIAKINREFRSDPVYDHDVRFTDRLKMNPQTGDLTITNITSELTGHYQLVIDRKKPITKSFSVSLSPEVKIVKERDSVTLHIDVTDEQRNDQIHWKIKHNKSPVAEIITVNGTISTHLIEERFRDRLKLDDQTGSLTITHMKNEDSGPYEADVTIGSITHTIHKTFSVTDSGLSPEVKIVKERDSVTLHIDVTDEQRNDQIHWKIKHNKSPVAEIITVNGKISTHLIEERFRDRLKLDDQTGSLTITHMKNEDSGPYEADVTIGSNTHTIHKTFSVTDSEVSDGPSTGVIAGICVSLLVLAAAAGAAAGVIYRHRKMRRQDSNTGEESTETNDALRNGDVPPV